MSTTLGKALGQQTVWLDKDIQWLAATTGKRGLQLVFTDAATQFCLSIKCPFGLPLRQSLDLVESLLSLAGTICAGVQISVGNEALQGWLRKR